MKECPACRKEYSDDYNFCLEDGASLWKETVKDEYPTQGVGAAPPTSFGSSPPLRSFDGLDKLDPTDTTTKSGEESSGGIRKFFSKIIMKLPGGSK